MSLASAYCESKYYQEFDTEKLLKEVQEKLNPSISRVEKEFQSVFHKLLHEEPCNYWNKDVYNQTIALLENLFQMHSQQIEIDEGVFNFFLMGYNAYSQISDTIVDLKNFNLAQDIKTRLYRLPTYTSLLEGCLSNLLRVICILTGQAVGKDYSAQNTLGQLIGVTNANGYSEISNRVNVNIRNAINHGKVLIKKKPIEYLCFFFVENHIPKNVEMPIYEFDRVIDETYDCVSAVFLAVAMFVNNHIDLLKIDQSKKEFTAFARLAMQLSLPGIQCKFISDIDNAKQLNVEIEIENTDRAYIGQVATMLSVIIYNKYNEYEQYWISFTNPRMVNGWVRYTNQEIYDVVNDIRTFGDVLEEVLERKDFVIFPTSTEVIDLNEVKYFCFPNYSCENYRINNVQDASTMEHKRIKANLYIGEVQERKQILQIVDEAIEWLSAIKNPPSPVLPQKHGEMPADSVYINVYRNDGRKSKELVPANENFVCFVDYNITGVTKLEHGGMFYSIWKNFYHEGLGNKKIAWRTSEFYTRRVTKIGRNDPCTCGSGLKYKHCCGSHK